MHLGNVGYREVEPFLCVKSELNLVTDDQDFACAAAFNGVLDEELMILKGVDFWLDRFRGDVRRAAFIILLGLRFTLGRS